MRITTILGAALALALIATPAAAKPKDDGHTPPGQAKKEQRIEHPEDAPGNSGWAQWCKVEWAEADEEYRNQGACVSDHAGDRQTEEDED